MFYISDSKELSYDDYNSLISVLDSHRDFCVNRIAEFANCNSYDTCFDEMCIAWINSVKTKLFIKLKEAYDSEA